MPNADLASLIGELGKGNGPPGVDEILERLEKIPESQRNRIIKQMQANEYGRRLWVPMIGPQFNAARSNADIIGYGGAAGGGKTDLICGLALTEHRRSAIFRREKAQTEGIIQRIVELLGTEDGLNSQKGIWKVPTKPERLIEFGGLDNLGDENRFKGRPHDLKAFDEVTEMRESQVRFLMGWARTSDPQQRVRRLLTFNPPTSVEGRWVMRFFAPWLDKKHPNRAMPGELRWFCTIDGDPDFEVPDGRKFVWKNGEFIYDFDERDYAPEEIVQPLSRTFFPARASENIHYRRTGYIAQLQSMPEPLRSQLLYGDFEAGIEDDAMQVIPTSWVEKAMDRWRPAHEMPRKVGPMDSMGVDVARGGRDATVISRRHGTWFDDLVVIPGEGTPDGPTVASHVVRLRKDMAPVHVDVVGWGASVVDALRANGIHTIAVNGASKSLAMSKEGELRFFNQRSELWWRLREALDPNNPNPIALPDDALLLADLTSPLWELAVGGIKVESKAEIQKRIGRSPDRGDAIVYALISTMKASVTLGPQIMDYRPYDPYAGD